MKKIKKKVFDAYCVKNESYYENLGVDDSDLLEYHNQPVNSKGYVSCRYSFRKDLKPIKPLDEDITETTKYELEKDERETLQMLKTTMNQAEQLYDSCKRKYHRYESLLVDKLDIDVDIYDGEYWECKLSPLGRCLYTEDDCGESICVFCGEPEERK